MRVSMRDFILAAAVSVSIFSPFTAEAQNKKHPAVAFITGGATGTWFPTGAAIADLTNAQYEGQPISVVPGPGGVGNALNVASGQSGLGISYGPFLKMAREGKNELFEGEGFPDLRAIASMTSNMFHLIISADTDPNLFQTLKAKKTKVRIGAGAKGSTEYFAVAELLRLYGTTVDEVDGWGGSISRVGAVGIFDGYKNRQIDVIISMVGVGASRIQDAFSSRPTKLLSLDDKVRQAFVKDWGYVDVTLPANTYPGQTEPVKTVDLPTVAFTTTKLSADFVYDITKAMAEHKDRLVAGYAGFKEWEPESMHKGVAIPLHEGAIRYYKQRGWM